MAVVRRRQHRTRREYHKRREERVNVALPVRVVVLEQQRREFACTLDVTSKGARLDGLRGVDLVGEILEIQRGKKRDRFKVVWVGEPETSQAGQIGVQCLGAGTPIWEGIALQPPVYPAESIAGEGRAPVAIPRWYAELPETDPEERRRLFRYAAATVIAFCLVVIVAARSGSTSAAGLRNIAVPQGMDRKDAQHIRNLQGWRLAQPGDFDPDALLWLQQQGLVASGEVQASFTSNPQQRDSAYLLMPTDPQRSGTHRLVLLFNRESRYDSFLPQVAFFARVPRERMASIEWMGDSKTVPPDGDGILVVRRYDDPTSGVVFFPNGVRIFRMTPKDYRTISLR
jgi:hypothetical protein